MEITFGSFNFFVPDKAMHCQVCKTSRKVNTVVTIFCHLHRIRFYKMSAYLFSIGQYPFAFTPDKDEILDVGLQLIRKIKNESLRNNHCTRTRLYYGLCK